MGNVMEKDESKIVYKPNKTDSSKFLLGCFACIFLFALFALLPFEYKSDYHGKGRLFNELLRYDFFRIGLRCFFAALAIFFAVTLPIFAKRHHSFFIEITDDYVMAKTSLKKPVKIYFADIAKVGVVCDNLCIGVCYPEKYKGQLTSNRVMRKMDEMIGYDFAISMAVFEIKTEELYAVVVEKCQKANGLC